ncbi:MAG: SRPBCC family protein [Chloroflexi bacterium]|nr:SRPBCC family protein [Chloroflexota bacterium]
MGRGQPTVKSVEKISPGPHGLGTRYRGVMKGFGELEIEVAEYEPGRRFSHISKMPVGDTRHVFTLERVPGGTHLTQRGELAPNLLGWIVSPLVMMMVRRRFRKVASEWTAYLANQKGAKGSRN